MQKFCKVVGETPEGRHVVSGVYRLCETVGFPLDILIEELWARGIVPSWEHYWEEASAAGMKPRTIGARIKEAASLMERLNAASRASAA